MPRCSDLHHIFKLTHVQIVVEAFLRKQLRCIALLDDAAVVAAALRLAGTYVKPEHREKVRHMFPFFRVHV